MSCARPFPGLTREAGPQLAFRAAAPV